MSDVAGSGDYTFARRPIWIAGLVIAVGMAALFVVLGAWQLRRHDERRDLAATVESGLSAPPSPLSALDLDDTDAARHRSDSRRRVASGSDLLVGHDGWQRHVRRMITT